MKTFGGRVQDILEEITEQETEKVSDEAMVGLMTKISEDPRGPRVRDLETLWKRAWVRGGHGYCPALSGKDQGNLKALVRNLGPVVASAYIVAAVEHWVEFRTAVDKETTFDHSEQRRPAVWFLLTNEGPGVAWLRKQQKAQHGAAGGASGKDWSILDD